MRVGKHGLSIPHLGPFANHSLENRRSRNVVEEKTDCACERDRKKKKSDSVMAEKREKLSPWA